MSGGCVLRECFQPGKGSQGDNFCKGRFLRGRFVPEKVLEGMFPVSEGSLGDVFCQIRFLRGRFLPD